MIPCPDCQAQVPSGYMAQIKVHLEMHWCQWQEMDSFIDFQLGLCHLSLNFHSEFRSNSPQVCSRAEEENLAATTGYEVKASPKSKTSILQCQSSLSCQALFPGSHSQLSMFNEGWMRCRVNRAGRWALLAELCPTETGSGVTHGTGTGTERSVFPQSSSVKT